MHRVSHLGRSSKRRSSSAFTLIEVVLSLTLLALLSGMVFGIVRVSLKTAFDTRTIQMENDQLSHFLKLCRLSFQNLPATATLSLEITQNQQPIQQELRFSGMPEVFSFGSNPISYEDSILALRPETASMQTDSESIPRSFIGISRADLLQMDADSGSNIAVRVATSELATADDQGRYWMPLLYNVESLQWRFLDASTDEWKEEWDSATLPALIEMQLKLATRHYPLRLIFSVPSVKLTQAASNGAGNTSSTGPSSTLNNVNNLGTLPATNNNSGNSNSGQSGGRGRGGRGTSSSPGGAQGGANTGGGAPNSANGARNNGNFTVPN